MPSPIRLLSLGAIHWLRTQSVYHALAETMTAGSPDTIVLTRPAQPYLCLGYHQELEAVLDRAACAALGLPIVRRRVGGGATYLDSDQLFYQCLFHHTRVPATVSGVYAQLLAAPVATLRALGLSVELRGENEIEVGGDRDGHRAGKRIAGIGGGRIGEAAVVVGNILFDFDYEAMARAWRVPSESFRRLAAEALRECVTTLRRELPRPVPPDDVQAVLIYEFARALGRPVKPGELTPQEARKIGELDRRLVSTKWLNLQANGAKPMTALKISRGVFIHAAEAKIANYKVRAAFRVRDDVIERTMLESEPERDWREAAENLRGTKVREWVRGVEAQI